MIRGSPLALGLISWMCSQAAGARRSPEWVAVQDIRIAKDAVREVGFEPVDSSHLASRGPAVWSEASRGKKMVIWHLPKTGGTTVCNLFKATNLSTTKMNCWENADGPEWW